MNQNKYRPRDSYFRTKVCELFKHAKRLPPNSPSRLMERMYALGYAHGVVDREMHRESLGI